MSVNVNGALLYRYDHHVLPSIKTKPLKSYLSTRQTIGLLRKSKSEYTIRFYELEEKKINRKLRKEKIVRLSTLKHVCIFLRIKKGISDQIFCLKKILLL